MSEGSLSPSTRLDLRPTPPTRCGAINVSLFWATGNVADANGLATFAAHTAPGEIEGEVGFGAGLTNPLGAEVHVIIRDHGLVIDLLGQLIQLNACNPTCKNVQAVIHLQ